VRHRWEPTRSPRWQRHRDRGRCHRAFARARQTLMYPNAPSVQRNRRRPIDSVQEPELPFDHREEPTEPLRGQIRGEGFQLPAGSNSQHTRGAYLAQALEPTGWSVGPGVDFAGEGWPSVGALRSPRRSRTATSQPCRGERMGHDAGQASQAGRSRGFTDGN
jgi:hypothetical protein